jgi:hypothetical protein
MHGATGDRHDIPLLTIDATAPSRRSSTKRAQEAAQSLDQPRKYSSPAVRLLAGEPRIQGAEVMRTPLRASVPPSLGRVCRATLLASALCGGTLLCGVPARAAAPDADQAKAMQDAIQSWLSGLVGQAASKLPRPPVQVTAAGDHYVLAVPFDRILTAIMGVKSSMPGPWTMNLAPRDESKWEVEQVHFPTPWTFSIHTQSGAKTVGMDMRINVQKRTAHGLVDPTFASPSTLESATQGLDMTMTSETGERKTERKERVDNATSKFVLAPEQGTTVNASEDGTFDGMTVEENLPSGHALQFRVHHGTIGMRFDDVDRVKLASMVTNLVDWFKRSRSMSSTLVAQSDGAADGKGDRVTATNAKTKAAMGERFKAEAHALLLAMRDLVRGGEIHYSLEGVQGTFDGHAGAADKVALGTVVGAPNGMLGAHLQMAADGLTVADLPPPLRALMPKHLAMRPFVAGISVADMTKIALDATAPHGDAHALADRKVLFNHGGLTTGIDGLAIELCGTSITGAGKVVFTSPKIFSGNATITAKNFDQLMQTVQKVPAAAKIVPVLVMARGLGHADHGKLVWNIEIVNDTVKVNGTDLRAMTQGAK